MKYFAWVLSVTFCWLSSANAQLITAYTGDEAPPKNWIIDVTTGDDVEGPLGESRALASDPATNRIFEIEDRRLGRSTVSLRISEVGPDQEIIQGSSRAVVDSNGQDIRFITALAFGNGTLYAQSSGNSRVGVPPALGTIDLESLVFTPLPTAALAPSPRGMTFDTDRDELLIGTAQNNVLSIFAFDPATGVRTLVVDLPPEEGNFDGLAYGDDRIWMDCGSSNACGDISVYNRLTGAFEAPLDTPNRFGNGSGGAAFLEALAVSPPPPPPPDGGLEVFLTFRSNTNVPGVGTVADEDVVAYDAEADVWSLVFDGSDVGIAALEISGLAILESGDMLVSFTAPGAIPGLVGGPSGEQVDDSDIVRFVPTALGSDTIGRFEFFFDGSDVALSANGEDIDAIATTEDGRLLVSTVGRFAGAGANGADEDLMLFTGSLGAATLGSFERFFDGSDVGLGGKGATDVDAAGLTASGTLLLSIVKDATIEGSVVGDEDVLEFSPASLGTATSGTFDLFLDLSTLGINAGEDVGALFVVE